MYPRRYPRSRDVRTINLDSLGYRRRDPAPETTAINYATKLSHRLITLSARASRCCYPHRVKGRERQGDGGGKKGRDKFLPVAE